MAAPLQRKLFLPSRKLERVLTRCTVHSTRVMSSNNITNRRKPMSNDQHRSRPDTSSNVNPNLHNSPEVSAANLNGRLSHLMQVYEDFVGLTEVKQAQAKVCDAEKHFLQVQDNRRTLQHDIIGVQAELRSLGNELEKTNRTDSGYIELVKKEHEVLLVEKEMNNKIKDFDKAERDYFSLLSAAVRESHEKERARAERTKYWSVIGSVIGAVIGITGSTWNNRKRLKEMRGIVTESGESAAQYKEIATKLLSSLSFLQGITTDDLSVISDRNENNSISQTVPQDSLHDILENTNHIIGCISEQTDLILSDLKDVKRILCVHNAQGDEKSVVYVGPELKHILDETKSELQNDTFKTMVSISVVGCFLTVGLSVLAAYFRGS